MVRQLGQTVNPFEPFCAKSLIKKETNFLKMDKCRVSYSINGKFVDFFSDGHFYNGDQKDQKIN
jgi:hypothetical protein